MTVSMSMHTLADPAQLVPLLHVSQWTVCASASPSRAHAWECAAPQGDGLTPVAIAMRFEEEPRLSSILHLAAACADSLPTGVEVPDVPDQTQVAVVALDCLLRLRPACLPPSQVWQIGPLSMLCQECCSAACFGLVTPSNFGCFCLAPDMEVPMH